MDFFDVLRSRRSIRRFSHRKVSPAFVKKVVEAGTFAPTNCNQQLWNFVVITDDGMKERLVLEAASSTIIRRAPVVVVVLYDGWSYKEAIQGASLALQNMLLTATYLGVGCLSMNSYGSDEKIKSILNIPENQTICCFMLLGYPEEEQKNAPRVPRRSVDEVLHRETFSRRSSYQEYNSYNPENWSLESLREFQKYYCRKTFLGKEMDIMHHFEKDIVRRSLKSLKGKVMDLFSYDGAYLDLFPETVHVSTLDLCAETSEYTMSAVKSKECLASFDSFGVYDENKDSFGIFDAVSLLYKAERLPRNLLKYVFKQSHNSLTNNGGLLIVSRRNNIFFFAFYKFIKFLFGDDTRKTGVYAFFGPYHPLSVPIVKKDLVSAGFTNIQIRKYCVIPPFFEQAYQMYLQYKKSGGSTYLHRIPIMTPLTRFLGWLISVQGLRRSMFGSIVVVRARK